MKKDVSSVSPTPSLESLTGSSVIQSNLPVSLEDGLGLESALTNGGGSISPEMGSTSSGSTNGGSPHGGSINGSGTGCNGGLVPSSKCPACHDTFSLPKVLPCLHSFCQLCLEKIQDHPEKLTCPVCQQECNLSSSGASGLLTDYALSNMIESAAMGGGACTPHCTGCKSRESPAVARCFDCANFLCSNCVMAHQFMHCFESHRLLTLGELQNSREPGGEMRRTQKLVPCPRHRSEALKFFCHTCTMPICKECTLLEHPKGLHNWEILQDISHTQVQYMAQGVQESRAKATDLRGQMKNLEQSASRLQAAYHKAHSEVTDTALFYKTVLEERKQEVLKEMENLFNSRQMTIHTLGQKTQEAVDKLYQTVEFSERLLRYATHAEVLMFKKLFDERLQSIGGGTSDATIQSLADIEFISNFQAIQVGIRNTFGYVRTNGSVAQNIENPAVCSVGPGKQPPIARPSSASPQLNGCHMNGYSERPYVNGHALPFEASILGKRLGTAGSLGPFAPAHAALPPSDLGLNGLVNGLNGFTTGAYEKWSSGSNDSTTLFQNGSDPFATLTGNGSGSLGDPLMELSSKLMASPIFPPKSQLKRQKMIYHCKFGEFGVLEGQFTEPSGVAVNAQNDIIVADTNNHRIQIFDREGRFKFQFGECGKRDGQLLYPNRVAVVRPSGDIVVTERSPTHQIQLYNQYGQFVRKFGANILQHPRGVTVDNKGRIIVVECKVMRVLIFDQLGNVLQKFGCSKHLEFPNGVVVNDKQEIFISDNRAHCVKVFNYEGNYLRQIGGEGITNYPIGVGINSSGEILIADNHNNFNLTIFTQEGQLVSALESKVKHAQCFDVALMDDGSVVLASKDYRLYIYRYVQVPPLGL